MSEKNKFTSTFNKIKNYFLKEKNPMETIIGFIVILIALIFLIFALSKVDTQTVKGYEIYANFSSVGGLEEGAEVKINGVKVGNVTKEELDLENYQVKITLSIKDKIKIPKDSSAEVLSNGILGDKYLKIKLGTSEEFLEEKESIKGKEYKTIENLISEFIFKEE